MILRAKDSLFPSFGVRTQVFLANHYAHTGIINPVTKTLAYFPAKVFQYKPRKRACSVCQINLAKFVVYEDKLSTESPSFWCEVCTKMRGGLEVRMNTLTGDAPTHSFALWSWAEYQTLQVLYGNLG